MDYEQDAQESISLTEEDKLRLYQPWCLLKLNEPLTLVDLGSNYQIAKFSQVESISKVLHEGPWFVIGNFLTVKRWEPNFVPPSRQYDSYNNMGEIAPATNKII
ncbi:hypothetical protein H5410_026649 [Solanum commersonii]|uniref:DUF4283 domain-containing protein n=1 Tax=Solanum commersonii TaxID=4109 RepID=A0A9J5YZ51_SOLCO|nr:hypothetical protein H5410_026649 [Solanum commersonii]